MEEQIQTFFFKLFVSTISAYMGEEQVNQATDLSGNGGLLASQNSIIEERASSLFNCEELTLSCEFGHDREVGVAVKDLDITCGAIMMNLSAKLLLKSQGPPKKVCETVTESAVDQSTPIVPQKKQGLMKKYSTLLPEKASFSLPKLGLRFAHQEHDLFVDNEITGVQLKSCKSRSSKDGGESRKHDVQLDLSEIHLLREAGTSVLEVLKVTVSSSVYVPIQATSAIRAEIEVCLGGTQCHVILSRLKPWMRMHTMRKKNMVLKEKAPKTERVKSSGSKSIMWTCTVSAPDMTIVLYSMSGLHLFHGCSQSSHVYANNVSSAGTTVHIELGEINLHVSDEYQEFSKESLFGVETNSGSLLHIAKVRLDWRKKDADIINEKDLKSGLVLSVDVTGMGVYLAIKRMEPLIAVAMSLKALSKTFSGSKNKLQNGMARSSKSSGKGTRLFNVNLERCSINFSGDVDLDNTVIEDLKRVNYGSQGGRVVVSVSVDGTKRTADIISTVSDECKKLKYHVSLEIFHFTCLNKEKNSVQLELERAKSNYQEHPEEPSLGTKVLLLDMQNAKLVRRSGGLKEIAVCSLFSATDIAVRWEPDVHITLFELMLHLKLLVHHYKLQTLDDNLDIVSGSMEIAKEHVKESGHVETQQKKKEFVFAVDVEMLRVSAEAGDCVETTIQVQSNFLRMLGLAYFLKGSCFVLMVAKSLEAAGCRFLAFLMLPVVLVQPNGTG